MAVIRWFVGLAIRIWILFLIGCLAWAWRLRTAATPPPDPAADEIDLVAAFGQADLTSTAAAFRGGRVTAAFGGGMLDLRGATLDPGGARLELRATFGGYQIVVPAIWRVSTDVLGIAGGVADGRDAATIGADGPVLAIDGVVAFGGAGVVSARRDAAAAMAVLAGEAPPA